MNIKYMIVALLSLLLFAPVNTFAQVLMPFGEASQNTLSLNGIGKFRYFSFLRTRADSAFYQPGFDISG